MKKKQLFKILTIGLSMFISSYSLWAQNQNALDFDGVDDNVQITHFNRPDTLTIEAWVKNTTEPGERDIISWSNSAGGFTSEFLQEGDSVYYAEWNGTLWSTSFRADISDGNWHHIAIVRNGNGPNNVSMYRDGVLLGTNTINSSGPTDDLRIGAENYNVVQRFYSGTLDELRIWNYAKTQVEIQANLGYELSGTESGLILIYNFNQGIPNGNNPSVTSLIDSGPNSNIGTLNNFALNGPTSNWVGGAPITTLSIIENSFGIDLLVYPNPTSGDFSINLGTAYENVKIEIIDISGKMIESKTITQSQILNLSLKESVGIYIVSIQAGNKNAVIRMLKE